MSAPQASQPTMRRSYLVQRLRRARPVTGPLDRLSEAFMFGGGLRNGGLSDSAMALLRDLFTFDYMGSAEYEWGAVPDALRGLAADSARLQAFDLSVPLVAVPASWRAPKGQPAPTGNAHVWVLCRSEHRDEVAARITTWATQRHSELMDDPRLTAALRPHDEWDTDTVGGLELDNGFLFFTDRKVWARTCALFGVEAPDA